MSAPIYLIVFELQRKQVESHCWGDGCGHGVVGCVTVPMGGGELTCVPCSQIAADCPILDREMPEPMGEVEERPAHLRKLKDV
jgi:hypothetical protein